MVYKQVNNILEKELEVYHQIRDNILKDDGSFIADSPKVVNILLQNNIEVKSILATQSYYDEFKDLLSSKNIPTAYIATKEDMQKIVGHKIHHNCMMHGKRKKITPLNQLSKHIIMLDSITSTQNVGAIARSAAALGIGSYLVPNISPHPYSRRALRVSMGYISHLNYSIYDNILETIEKLQTNGYKVFGAEISSTSIKLQKLEIPDKWVLIMGHEGKGLSKEVIDACDECVEIEMGGDVKSFNVATAASILMYNFIQKSKNG